ncbi:hypothetical protein F2Q68_00034626 [Brassica cretica]|uniref:Uncharacterized protein n=1 Tax=Brassica cretica TaxID=69181 RepID=A0A8S9H3M1_BRACR|nr:hypothetical protein F2Q68_00034626 [Brassica cretica]
MSKKRPVDALMGVDMLVLDSKKREIFDDLASLLWHSVVTVPALLQLGQAHEWRKAEESLSSHFNILNRGGMDANENFSSQFSSAHYKKTRRIPREVPTDINVVGRL